MASWLGETFEEEAALDAGNVRNGIEYSQWYLLLAERCNITVQSLTQAHYILTAIGVQTFR